MTPPPGRAMARRKRPSVQPATSRWRGAVMAIVAALVTGVLAIVAPTAATAAPGDFTLELQAPTDVDLGESYNYVATLNFEGVDSQNPATGVVLTTTLPEGVEFTAVPEGPGEVVASHTYDPATRVLTLVLNDTTQSVVSVAYTVGQVDNTLKYEGFALTTDITGAGGPSGAVISDPVTTLVHGDNDYRAVKSFSVVAGSDNRTVTYRFNVGAIHPDTFTTFSTWAQTLTDTFPAGAQLVAASPAFNGGAWDTSTWPTATWTRAGLYEAGNLTLDPSGQEIWLRVYYPDTVPGWEDFASPEANTVELTTEDANGTVHAGTPDTTQAPPFLPAGGAAVGAVKEEIGPSLAGFLVHENQTAGSYVGPATAPNAEFLTLTDSGAAGSPNADWFNHVEISDMLITFDPVLAAQDLEYTFEYQIDGSTTWTTYTGATIATGRTGSSMSLSIYNDGSVGWTDVNQDVLVLPVGSTLSGWRLSVAPSAGETVAVGSEARVRMGGQPVFRGISDSIAPSDAPAAVAPGTLPNTLTVETESFIGEATSQFTPADSVYLTTHIDAPASLSVGGTGSYRATIVNQNPSETYTDSVMSVVLPCGVQYDPAQAITPVSPTTVGVAPAPAVGAGVSVDASGRITDADGCEQQVVRFTFDAIAPMRPPGTANDRWVEINGWNYDIPVTVLAQAYDPNDSSVPAYSYVHSADPRFISVADGGTGASTVPMAGYIPFFGDDVHDFDAVRDSIAVSTDISTINVAGGLLISKLSSAAAEGPWALTSEVGTDAFWQIFVSDVLPNPVTDAVLFDKLPSIADGDEFDTVLAGAVTGAPADAVVEYSTDAADATSGTWTTDPTGATAFRVTIPAITLGESFTLIVPTDVLGTPEYGSTDTNAVTADAIYNGNAVAFDSNEAAVVVAAAPAIEIVKFTNAIDVPTAADAPVVGSGSQVTWSYEVTNSGNTVLGDVNLADIGGPDGEAGADVTVTPPAGFDGSLAPGESATFTATGTAIDGLYHNVATTTGTPVDAEGTPIPAVEAPTAQDESWYTGTEVALAIVKEVSAAEDGPWTETVQVGSGESVFWRLTVTNTGELPLSDIVVTDPQLVDFGQQTIDSLAPGESATIVVEQAALDADVTNVATATVSTDGGPISVSDDASATVIVPTPQPTEEPTEEPSATPTPEPSPEPSQTPTVGGVYEEAEDWLADTGANVAGLALFALGLVAAGVALAARRRRSDASAS